MRSVHTSNFSAILQELGISVLVTTYQAGKLVMLRPDGGRLNTHFRGFGKPMGLAVDGDRLAIGTSVEIWEYHNAPAVARRLEPVGRHDACFLPRSSVCTGDVQIHEMAWANSTGDDPELWSVNTRFSCLCTRSNTHSFVPRWRPPFISALAPEDRCHLNGLCLVEGQPGFVTALGTTDTPGGWRNNKKSGGVLLDVVSGEVVSQGLSMPHSPRWRDGQLWVLESAERCCGIWVVDTRTGQTVAFVKFEDAIQEIFAVQVLPGIRHPDVVNDQPRVIADSFIVPDEALEFVPGPLRHAAQQTQKPSMPEEILR